MPQGSLAQGLCDAKPDTIEVTMPVGSFTILRIGGGERNPDWALEVGPVDPIVAVGHLGLLISEADSLMRLQMKPNEVTNEE